MEVDIYGICRLSSDIPLYGIYGIHYAELPRHIIAKVSLLTYSQPSTPCGTPLLPLGASPMSTVKL
jgi:hypothetical protein